MEKQEAWILKTSELLHPSVGGAVLLCSCVVWGVTQALIGENTSAGLLGVL